MERPKISRIVPLDQVPEGVSVVKLDDGREIIICSGPKRQHLTACVLSSTSAPPPPPPPGPEEENWVTTTPERIENFPAHSYGIPAVPTALAWRVFFHWTPWREVDDEYELVWLVRRGPDSGLNEHMLGYVVLRQRGPKEILTKLRTGVGVKMPEKATAECRWKPTLGSLYEVTMQVSADGSAWLRILDSMAGSVVVALSTPMPEKGKPGPWPWSTVLQLGDELDDGAFENLSVQALMPASGVPRVSRKAGP